jgi:arylsulfatase A-like enzyme
MKIALITFDSLRVDYVGCYNPNKNLTPNLNRIAKRGAVFTNHFSTSYSTILSFASIFTSSYPLMFGGYKKGIKRRLHILNNNDFYTVGFHSNAFLIAKPGYTQGFCKCKDLRHGVETSNFSIYIKYILNDKTLAYARAEEVVEEVLEEVKNNKILSKEKVFLWVHFMDNHHPYLPPAKFSEGYLTNPLKRARAAMLYRKYGRKSIKSEKIRRIIKKLYELTVKYVDYSLGLLIEGLGEDWVYIITSDHGEEFWEHGGTSHQRKLYDEIIKVPLIVYGLEKGKFENLTDHTDIAPTILNIANIDKPKVYIGNNIFLSEKEYIYSEDYKLYAIRDKEYKLIYDEKSNIVELYNIRKDPLEQENLIFDEPEILKEYLNTLEKFRMFIREFELKASVKIAESRLYRKLS